MAKPDDEAGPPAFRLTTLPATDVPAVMLLSSVERYWNAVIWLALEYCRRTDQMRTFFTDVLGTKKLAAMLAAVEGWPVEQLNPFPFRIICWMLEMLTSGLMSESTAPFCACATKRGLDAESAEPRTWAMLMPPMRLPPAGKLGRLLTLTTGRPELSSKTAVSPAAPLPFPYRLVFSSLVLS